MVEQCGKIEKGVRCSRYATFFSTKAEFFDPKATQLHTAFSISACRPA